MGKHVVCWPNWEGDREHCRQTYDTFADLRVDDTKRSVFPWQGNWQQLYWVESMNQYLVVYAHLAYFCVLEIFFWVAINLLYTLHYITLVTDTNCVQFLGQLKLKLWCSRFSLSGDIITGVEIENGLLVTWPWSRPFRYGLSSLG